MSSHLSEVPAADPAAAVGPRVEPTAEASFEQIFVALRKQVFGVCFHITGNVHDADDALQETFLAVSKALPRFRGEARLSTWVHRIAICCAVRIRSGRRATLDVHEIDPPAHAEDPLVAGELAARIAAALARLSADHRVVLSLFAIDELGHAEIADILGVPEGTVWSRLHAARKRLGAEIGHPT